MIAPAVIDATSTSGKPCVRLNSANLFSAFAIDEFV